MNSKQVLIVLSIMVVAVAFVQATSDSFKCKKFAEAQKGQLIDLEELAKVGEMRMYGPGGANKSCKEVCESKSFSVGFNYVGKQACCCGNIEQQQ